MLSTPQNSAPEGPLSPGDEALTVGLAALRLRLAAAAQAAGRDVRSITLLAVSKGQPATRLKAALALGLWQFGENYLEEALVKINALAGMGAEWHFIGRLQGNKTRPVAENFAWVHGIDRARIAQRLSEQRPLDAPPLNICAQVNIAGEASKSGVAPDEALVLLRSLASLPRLRLRGLMCMLPFDLPGPQQHRHFAALRGLLDAANAEGLGLDTLSMGMSGDLAAAVAEGATIVRIGTALFGPRPT
jgi:pyridoxal phosphate enzyme (YggS family)